MADNTASRRETKQAAAEALGRLKSLSDALGNALQVFNEAQLLDLANNVLEAEERLAGDTTLMDTKRSLEDRRTELSAKVLSALDPTEVFTWDNFDASGWSWPDVPAGAALLGLLQGAQVPAVVPLFDTSRPPEGVSSLFVSYALGEAAVADRIVVDLIARLLVTAPPGQVRLLLCDADGLGGPFAAFSALGEHDRDMVGGKVWTAPDEIRRALQATAIEATRVVTEELAGRHHTLAEVNTSRRVPLPYRLVVVRNADRLEAQSLKSLEALVSTGGAAGHHVLLTGEGPPPDRLGGTLRYCQSMVVGADNRLVGWRPSSPTFNRHGQPTGSFLFAELMPTEHATALATVLPAVCGRIATAHRDGEADRTIGQADPSDAWSRTTQEEIRVVIGAAGDRDAEFHLSSRPPVSALVLGGTGSGKSTLMHTLICGLARTYSPDELELMLVDLKQGSELALYAGDNGHGALPHASIVAAAQDPGFAISVLRSLMATINDRAALFQATGVNELALYRQRTGKPMRRIVALLDEFTGLFQGSDRREAADLLAQVAKQGRSYGIHLILATQSLGSTSEYFPQDVRAQFQMRIAMDNTSAAEIIEGKVPSVASIGLGLINDASGSPEATSTFSGAFLPLDERERLVAKLAVRASANGMSRNVLVFSGDVVTFPADIPGRAESVDGTIWLGRAVGLHGWTSTRMWNTTGGSMLVIGRAAADPSLCAPSGVMHAAVEAHMRAGAHVTVINQAARATKAAVAHQLAVHGDRVRTVQTSVAAETAISDFCDGVEARTAAGNTSGPAHHLIVFGLDRLDELWADVDSHKDGGPGKRLIQAARNGPEVGCHVTAWITDESVGISAAKALTRSFGVRVVCPMGDDAAERFTGVRGEIPRNRAVLVDVDERSIERFVPVMPAPGVPGTGPSPLMLAPSEVA